MSDKERCSTNPSKIQCSIISIDSKIFEEYYMTKKLSLLRKIYRKLFPTRYLINEKVKYIMLKPYLERLIEKVDQFIAYGDEIRK